MAFSLEEADQTVPSGLTTMLAASYRPPFGIWKIAWDAGTMEVEKSGVGVGVGVWAAARRETITTTAGRARRRILTDTGGIVAA